MAFDQGDVVLVPFPFCDRLGEKALPAVIVSGAAYLAVGDVVVQRSRLSLLDSVSIVHLLIGSLLD